MERPQNCSCGFFTFPEFRLAMEGRNFDDIFTVKEQFHAALAKFKIQDFYSTCCFKSQKNCFERYSTKWKESAVITEKKWSVDNIK
jgi:hypothetical protein